MITQQQIIVNEALKWVGTPFRHQGRTKRGLDCVGLVIRVGNDLHLMDYNIANYPRTAQREFFVQQFRDNMTEKPINEREHGDVLLMRQGLYTCHAGIYMQSPSGIEEVIHADEPHGHVLRERITSDLLSRVTQCFSWRIHE